jgi:hypothetical protein
VARAREAWGDNLPDWVLLLAEHADEHTATVTAKKLGYSSSIITMVTGNKYNASLRLIEETVRGALQGVTVMCPVFGELRRDICLADQKRPFTPSSAARVQQYHACRSTRRPCPHSLITGKDKRK